MALPTKPQVATLRDRFDVLSLRQLERTIALSGLPDDGADYDAFVGLATIADFLTKLHARMT